MVNVLTQTHFLSYNRDALRYLPHFINIMSYMFRMAKKPKKAVKAGRNPRPPAGGEKKLRITPLGDRVVVRPEKFEEKTAGGIIIPDTARQEKPEKGMVVAVGEGKMNDDGRMLPMRTKVGDKVMFSKYGYDEVKIDGEEYFIISESNVVAILK